MRLPYRRLRRVHLLLAPLMGVFLYSPSLRNDPHVLAIVQFGLFPAVALAGLALWLGPRLPRHRKERTP